MMSIPEPLKLKKPTKKKARRGEHPQSYCNNIIEILERITGIAREDLGIEAETRGTILGPLKLKVENKVVNYLKAGKSGYPIPTAIHDVKFVSTDADAILVVEKGETRLRLYKTIPDKLNVILVHSGGFLSRNTMGLLRLLYDKTELPVVMLNDLDYGGLNIFTVAKHYSVSSAHIPNLNIPNLKLLGIRAEDIDVYFKKYPDALDPAKPYDIDNAKRTLKKMERGEKQHFMEVKPDLEFIVHRQKLCESPAFNRIGLDATYKYVRDKLRKMDIKV